MPSWFERLMEDESARGHAQVYRDHLESEFKAMGDAEISRPMLDIAEKALFEFFDEAIEYSDARGVRIKVIDELSRLVAVLARGGRIKADETISRFAVDLLVGQAISGQAVRATSFQQDANGELLVDPSSLSYVVRRATLFVPDDLAAGTAKVDRLPTQRTDNQALALQEMPVRLPPHIIETIDGCRDPETGDIPLAPLRERLTSAERFLLHEAAERTVSIAEFALGIDDRVRSNHRTHTLVDYVSRPPLASFGLKLLEAGFRRDDNRRLLMTGDGEIDWTRWKRLVNLLVYGFNVAEDIRREYAELTELNLLIGYQAGRESWSSHDNPQEGDLAFEEVLRTETKPMRAARRVFMALVRTYESFFVLKLVNRFLDYYDLRLQQIERAPVNGAYELFFSRAFFHLRKWERELETQLKEGAVRSYDRFPRVSGTPAMMPVVPDDVLRLPMTLAYQAGSGVFACPTRELIDDLICVRFGQETAKRDACRESWRGLARICPPEALPLEPIEFLHGHPMRRR